MRVQREAGLGEHQKNGEDVQQKRPFFSVMDFLQGSSRQLKSLQREGNGETVLQKQVSSFRWPNIYYSYVITIQYNLLEVIFISWEAM